MSVLSIDYKASPTLAKFHASDAFVRGIRGPIGSGKSVGMCIEIFRRMREMTPCADGIRRSRFAIVRNTYPELETTTVKTWLDWFPEDEFGKFSRRVPMCHFIEFNDIKAEVYFLAIDRPEDVKKLLSLELTGIFFNEARELPLKVIQTGCDRVGRYPSQRQRPPHLTRDEFPNWYGVIMDTNSPDEDHWWAVMAGDAELPDDFTLPDNWEFFTQPSAAFEKKQGNKTIWVLNDEAENLENLPKGYYKNLISGKSNMHVRVYVGNKYGSLLEGQVVYPEFSQDMHVAEEELVHIPGRTIHVGLDFGNTPSAIFGESTINGQWRDIHELVCEGIGAKRFAHLLKREIANKFKGLDLNEHFEFWGDPSGAYAQGGQGEDETYFKILRGQGINVKPAPTQNPSTRIEAGREPLEGLIQGGVPAYQISPHCKVLIRGFTSGYHYKKVGSAGSVRFSDKPDKNKYSHPHEARQYALCGAGYARKLITQEQRKNDKVFKAKTEFSVYN